MDNMPPPIALGLMAVILVALAAFSFVRFVGMEGSSSFFLYVWIAFVAALSILGFVLARIVGKMRGGTWASVDIWITTLVFAAVAGGGTVAFLLYPFAVLGLMIAILIFAVFGSLGDS